MADKKVFKKGNVERIARNEDAAKFLKQKGFEELPPAGGRRTGKSGDSKKEERAADEKKDVTP